MLRKTGVARIGLKAAVLALLVLAAGCESAQSKLQAEQLRQEMENLRQEAASLQEQLRRTRDDLQQASREYDELNKQRASFQNELELAGIAPGGLERLAKQYPEPFRLIGDQLRWKEVTIRGENGADDAVRLTDPRQLEALSSFLHLKGAVGNGVMPSGMQAPGPIYTYTISDGKQTCTVTSYGGGFIMIEYCRSAMGVRFGVGAGGSACPKERWSGNRFCACPFTGQRGMEIG